MTSSSKISSAQLYFILFVCRVVALFTYMTPETINAETVNSVLLAVFFVMFQFVFAIPVFTVIKKDNSQGIIGTAKQSSDIFAKIISIIYCCAFIYAAGISVSRFELFVSTVMFPGAEISFFIALLLATSLFAVFKGIQSIGRSSAIILFAVGISTVFIILSVIKEFQYTNFLPVLLNGTTPLIQSSFYSATRTMELVSIMIIAPEVTGKLRSGFVKWIISFGTVAAVLFTCIDGILGAYGEEQLFQLYSLTLIAKFSIFERLDDLITGIWVLCTMLKTAFYCLVAAKCIEQGFGKKTTKLFHTGISISVFIVFLLTSGTVVTFSEIIGSNINSILYIVIAVFIPLAVFISTKIISKKRRKEGKLCAENQS